MKSFKQYLSEAEQYTEKQDSTFQNGKDVYRLNKLFKLSDEIKSVSMPISRLAWILEYSTIYSDRLKSADIAIPLLVWKSEGEWIVVDGIHRLTKAIALSKDEILVKVLDDSIMEQAKIRVDSNSKYN